MGARDVDRFKPSLLLETTMDCDESEIFCEVARMTSTGAGESASDASTDNNLLEESVLITPALLTRASCILVRTCSTSPLQDAGLLRLEGLCT